MNIMNAFMNVRSFPNALTRTINQPLDTSEVWDSLAAAEDYAKNGASYEGQIISVLKDGIYVPYIVQADGELKRATAAEYITGLATVATSGAYSDLSDKPTLATVATSGKYTDLDLTGAPVVNDATLTIQCNKSYIGTFSANSATNATINIEVPVVYDWAKAESKPSYTASEVGALSDQTTLANLTDDTDHRTVTDAEKDTWNAKSEFSGNYDDLDGKPSIPDPANNATIKIAAATIGATGTLFGEFTTNQSTDETISIPVASTTSAGLMSSQDKALLTNMQDMYDEWAENNRPKLSLSSFNVKGYYSSDSETEVTTNSVTLVDGFTFTPASLTWELNNTEKFEKVVLNVDDSISTVSTATITTLDVTDKIFSIGKTGTIAKASAYETSSSSPRSEKNIYISSSYVIRYGYSDNASETHLTDVSTTNTTSTSTTITGLVANNEFIYVFLPKHLYSYEDLGTADSTLKFFLDGALIAGGMTVVNETTYKNVQNDVESAELPYWVCRSSNKLTTSSTYKIEITE